MFKESDIEHRWNALAKELSASFDKIPSAQSALFLIGVNELGQGGRDFTKEEKQDLIHIGNCKVLSVSGYYELEGRDTEGWPVWKQQKSIPAMGSTEQELFIKWHILEYFEHL